MPTAQYGEIEIGLHRSQPEAYEIELRVTDPGTDAEVAPARGQARFSLDELAGLRNRPHDYGTQLASDLFSDPAIREFFVKNRVSCETRGLMLRLRILIGLSASELHGLRWELLRDPETNLPLATSERILFSRFMLSRDWRVVKLRPKSQLRALIAVSAPSDIVDWGMSEVDHAGEVARAREGLAGIDAVAFEKQQPVTMNRLLEGIRQGVDVLYLVCHGAMPKGLEPCLYLQTDEGKTDAVAAGELAGRIQELAEVPRLIVMASCESAGKGDGGSAQAALAPRLAEAGVPAVLAMQGRISMETVKRAMPVFFRELVRDGQIDRAMALARGQVRDQFDHWMPALFMRLKSGRIWYEPGFGGEGGNDDVPWDAVCRSVVRGDLVPIIGPDLAEHFYGTERAFAADLAKENYFAISPYEKPDAAKIAQRINTKFGSEELRSQIRDLFHKNLLKKARSLDLVSGSDLQDLSPVELISRLVDKLLTDPDEPLRILSQLNVKVYVNGATDPLLKLFLKRSGKRPTELFSDWRTECIVDESRVLQAADALCDALREGGASVEDVVSRWRDNLRREGEVVLPVSLESAADRLEEMLQEEPAKPAAVAEAWRDAIRKPPADTPSKPLPTETPLIYYVFGRNKYDNTWVLTEDDFFDYLIRATSYKLMPGIVADKLVAGSLLFLGFPLDDWKFRILFRMIMSKDGKGLLKSENYYHVGVQVDPEEHTPEEAARIRKFLEMYFGRAANVNIFWGSAADFLKGLRDHLRNPKFQGQPLRAASRKGW